MANLTQYAQAIQTLLQHYATFKPHQEEFERQIWIDHQNGHYQLLDVGWHDDDRIYDCAMHFDIKDNKVWIQENNTEVELDQELIALGIMPEDIVLGLLPPYRRPNRQQAA